MKFLLIVTGYNCPRYVWNCFMSIQKQTYKNFRAIFIDDGSTESNAMSNTYSSLIGFDPLNKFSFRTYTENKGATFRRYEAIKSSGENEETVILFLGMDDELLPDCLEIIKKEYDAGKWMTYGNWINQKGIGLPADFKLEFSFGTHYHRDYRKVVYRSTAPNTFKKFLFDRIPEEDFKINGEWITTTTESEVMFSCLEMCGKNRIGLIKKYIYLYNMNRPESSTKRLGHEYKRKILSIIKSRPKKPLLER